jgi:hypothetical protein
MEPIHTPYGVTPELPEPTDVATRLVQALCGDVEMIAGELSRLYVELDALRRRVTALERREPPLAEVTA